MLALRQATPLSSGDFRHCFLHPDDPTRCVKVLKHREDTRHHGRIDRLFRRGAMDPNQREYREYRRLTGAGVPLEHYFPKMYGMVETDLGTGLCLDLVRGDQGDAPVNLSKLMQGGGPDDLAPEFVLGEVMEFARFCQRYGILASCDEPGNIAFVRKGEGFRLISYDLKLRLNKEFIPVSTLFASVRRRKIQRRFDRLFRPLAHKLGQTMPEWN